MILSKSVFIEIAWKSPTTRSFLSTIQKPIIPNVWMEKNRSIPLLSALYKDIFMYFFWVTSYICYLPRPLWTLNRQTTKMSSTSLSLIPPRGRSHNNDDDTTKLLWRKWVKKSLTLIFEKSWLVMDRMTSNSWYYVMLCDDTTTPHHLSKER